MPVGNWVGPAVPRRARRPLAALLLFLLGLASFLHVQHKGVNRPGRICHPNLSHLRDSEDRELLLIGTLPLDLDGASGKLVHSALGALRPDVVMVEGTWMAGVNAMLVSGRWELHGMTPPISTNWSDIGDMGPVELPRPKKRGLLSFGGQPARWPERSLVPVYVGQWALHLRGSVGGDIASAVMVAGSRGVPVKFLGPPDGGFQGHMQVALLAQQAATELLEEEGQRGSLMPSADVEAAIRRAEVHVREDTGKWLNDARGETSRLMEQLNERVPAKVKTEIENRLEERTAFTASRVASTMKAYRKGAAVFAIDQLVAVESKLLQAGYSYVSKCA
mmetsp:Transcript_83281/g.178526  ORF Transcript_83281/g.178526 Transcript_83281/m.178526 type:complete len:334 (+) Transcript_83281:62-1063(+)